MIVVLEQKQVIFVTFGRSYHSICGHTFVPVRIIPLNLTFMHLIY